MLAYEVLLNGKKKCTAGIGEPGVLTTTVTWVLGEQRGRGASEEMSVRVGGLISGTYEFLDWFRRDLRRGDEVVIRILEAPKVDNPAARRRESRVDRVKQQRAYVRRMAKQFGWRIQSK